MSSAKVGLIVFVVLFAIIAGPLFYWTRDWWFSLVPALFIAAALSSKFSDGMHQSRMEQNTTPKRPDQGARS